MNLRNGAFNRLFENITVHEYSSVSCSWEPDLEYTPIIHLCKEFKGNLSTGIWNSSALFCRDSVKLVQRLDFACELAEKVDVLVIVEAHGQEGCQLILEEKLRKSHRVDYFPGSSQAVGGVIFCIKLRIITVCGLPTPKVLDKGRVISMTMTKNSEQLGVVGVHLDPHYTLSEKRSLLQRIADEVHSYHGITWLICGDFNFEVLGEQTYNADRGTFMESNVSENLGLAWNHLFGDFVEHYQPQFTRAQTGPSGATLSRIDRIYSNTPAWRLLGAEVRTSAVGRLTDEKRLSDHLSVLSFTCHSVRHITRPLPVWATRDPLYKAALDQQMELSNLEAMPPSVAVKRLKICMSDACKQVTRKSFRRGARTIEEQIYWSLVCVRAMFTGSGWQVARSILAYPVLEQFILVKSAGEAKLACNMDGINKHIVSLMQESLSRLRSDLESVQGLPEYQKDQRRNSVNRLMSFWATRGRKVSLQGARDQAGNVISNPDEAADSFIKHWKAVAEEKLIDVHAARSFLAQHMRKMPSFRTVLSFEDFVEIVRSLPDTACGPDGVPYSAWRHASNQAVFVLYRLYCTLFTTVPVAEDFNYSWLVLLAKGDHDDDDNLVARAADDTRPVSLANSDSKICEIALGKPLAGALASWASPDQRGFLEGRMMVDNVIEIDTYGRIATLAGGSWHEHAGRHTSLAVMAFFDFAAAFPSLAWMDLWMCMSYCGLPRPYIRAFKKVYKNNVHFLKFMGKIFRAYTNASGVKTGGTASGTLFVLCIDPFLRMLRTRVGPRDFGRGFADDIGYVIFNSKLTLPAIAECFELFGRVSNVKLKVKKTVVVPLWTYNMDEAMELIVSIVPSWKGIRVALHAKYLGMQLGPRTADLVWTSALDKYVSRVESARKTGAGLLSSVFEYNIMCVTTLSYIGQFFETSPRILATESRMLQRLTGCPRYTFTKEALWSLTALGMKDGFNSVKVHNTAAMVRMALRTNTVLTKMQTLFDEAINKDDCLMISLVSREAPRFDTPAIINTLQKSIDSAFLPDVQHAAWRLYLRSIVAGGVDVDVQKMISKYLDKATLSFNASEFLTRTMARWRPFVSEAGKDWWSFCGVFLVQLCQVELCGAPQCVIATYIKTILNGWASSRRLKLHTNACLFGCGSQQDSIEHYMECRHVEAIWKRNALSEWGPFESRLAVGCPDLSGRVARVYFLYGLYACYNSKRHRRIQGDVIEGCANAVKGKITYALGRSSQRIRMLFSWTQCCTTPVTQNDASKCIGAVIFNARKRSRAMISDSSGKRPLHVGPKRLRYM